MGRALRGDAGAAELEKLDVPIVGGFRSVSYDDETNHFLYNRDIEDQLKAWLSSGQRLDLLGFDACLMAMVETAYAFRDVASVMVASQELEPGSGWDYSKWLPTLVSNPSISGQQLGSAIVKSYQTVYGNSSATMRAAYRGWPALWICGTSASGAHQYSAWLV